MIKLREFREFWEKVSEKIPELTDTLAVTVDENMARKITGLSLGSRVLFWLPPGMEGTGVHVDAFEEKHLCVVFVMEKYDPSRKECIDVLESTQETIDRVLREILGSQWYGCSPIGLADLRISILPETKFFAGFAGWSLAFNAKG